MPKLYFEDVAIGQEIPPVSQRISAIQLFMFSAITWNRHRIHYDKDWARQEGYPDLVLNGSLYGTLLGQLAQEWAGDFGWLWKLSYQHRRPAFLGDTLTAKGVVRSTWVQEGKHAVECEVWVEKQDGEVLVPGSAVVLLPSRAN
ncbi:MAG: MaoC family dehydratase N-terminal domain-containing protein [Dehalococcoidia bacterium]